MKTVKSIVLITLTALGLIVACSHSIPADAASLRAGKDRKAAPDFALKDSNGAAVKLSDYKGKVVLLNFWATWCGPCKVEIPWFIEFQQQYKDKGFEVLGVAMDDEGWQAVKPYLTERKVNYRVLLGNDSVTQLYGGVDSLPTTFVIDKEGRIASAHVGLVAKHEYLGEIQSLLGIKSADSNVARSGAPLAVLASAAQ
jgi:cytochrome c biogenesis protein CcmG/thiol:disulfide interchange protein DsbE